VLQKVFNFVLDNNQFGAGRFRPVLSQVLVQGLQQFMPVFVYHALQRLELRSAPRGGEIDASVVRLLHGRSQRGHVQRE
jgi:hypothetical protein